MIAVKFAGYSWGEADKFRKAMGKKIPEIMAQQKEKFSKGCMKVGGLSEKQVKDLWESIETFAAYGFNKAHAASYGRIAYLTSYLKANYPVLYMTSVLTADSGDVEKVAEMVEESKRMGIEVLPPDINESFADFTAVIDEKCRRDRSKCIDEEKGEIRFGLTTIKNFGEGIARTIIKERKKGGKFKSLEDFLQRINDRNLNKKSMEALIKSGALDQFEERSEMLENLEDILAYSKEIAKGSGNQTSLFSSADISIPSLRLRKAEPISQQQQLAWEKELLGLYVSGHPLEQYKEKLDKGLPIATIKKKLASGMTTFIAGHIDDVKTIRTKKGEEMAFVRISDLSDNLEVVVFPKTYTEYKDLLILNKCVAIKGRISERNDEKSLLTEKVKEI